jgi:paraquat-inducible protein A
MNESALIACHACDLLHSRSPVTVGHVARCTRCGAVLYSYSTTGIDRPLAFTLAGVVLFVIANAAPFLTLSMEGRFQETILLSGVLTLYREGQLGLAGLAFFTGIAAPLIQLAGLTYVLTAMKLGRPGHRVAVVLRWVRRLQPWAMAEVFMLGILVSAAKLAQMADIVPGMALYAFMVLIFTLAAALATLNMEDIWEHLPVQTSQN